MAFSFGSAQPVATSFGGGLFGAPTASSAPAFGASSAPAFGAVPTPAFGASSAPAFGASSASAFGASSAPAFGATPSPFGAPAPTTSAPNLFGTTTTTFGTTGIFGQPTSAPATTLGIFGTQPQQAQQPQQPRAGLNYKTKFEELPPQIQQELQKIQQLISSYRDECKALDNDPRLYDTVSIKQNLDSDTAALRQILQSLYQAVVAEDEGLNAFKERVTVLLRSTEAAIRLYNRSRIWRDMSKPTGPGNQQQQQLLNQSIQECISQPVVLPNPYLELAVVGFSAAIEQYHSCISELERVMQTAAIANGAVDEATAVLNLPTLVSHMHDYFVHVAARMERLHKEVTRSREAYLARQRARGDFSDPFEEARPLHHMPPGHGKPATGNIGFGSSGVGVGSAGGGGGPAAAGTFGGPASTAPSAPTLALPMSASAPASSSGGLFGGLSPGPFGSTASPFGAPAGNAQQAQQQRTGATRTGSSNKKR